MPSDHRDWNALAWTYLQSGQSELALDAAQRTHEASRNNFDLPMLLAVLAGIDEYVTVSNTIIHLLAGLGRPARVLIRYPAEWRWMRRESRDWQPALRELRGDLGL